MFWRGSAGHAGRPQAARCCGLRAWCTRVDSPSAPPASFPFVLAARATLADRPSRWLAPGCTLAMVGGVTCPCFSSPSLSVCGGTSCPMPLLVTDLLETLIKRGQIFSSRSLILLSGLLE